MSKRYKLGRLGLAALILSGLTACANMTNVPPGEPLANVEAQFGRPNFTCELPNGVRRYIWTQQPQGQFAWGTNVGPDGRIDKINQLLTDANFQQLATGDWTPDRVRCTFGPPARISTAGLGNMREVVWSYRYRENSSWNSLMYVYMGPDGDRVTHFHPGPDPMYERAWWGD